MEKSSKVKESIARKHWDLTQIIEETYNFIFKSRSKFIIVTNFKIFHIN